ncbi:lipoprotein of unknown function DUF2314 [Citrifermentans bemidjiense Bem]|uniref:DUF2314 domain-containing protein n=1 Tax=Citrifermentans bemidjiense (strain ATCC BAA-1014 / DSM 16622 / JCM 12645 / Bem) TaxID=404380 RepID=B5EAZ6_CITBB|nr:DUF2314 domain-containing protein [Citrifermentans bemidjiense]ACH38857.1 lipoprotein of unknown function DUF2314 [Citrifermentans bemidjiense Bem]
MKRVLLLVVGIAMFMGTGCSRSADKEADNFKQVQTEDQAMSAAITKAKESSADFVRAFHEQQPGTKDFYVKKPYPTPSKNNEHMWIEVAAERNGVISGVIANIAEETSEVKLGDAVTVKVDEISDWRYLNGNKLVGGYTIRYFVDKMSPQEKAEFLKKAGFKI